MRLRLQEINSLAGVAGFEPANAGIKTRCLAAWRHPKLACLFSQGSQCRRAVHAAGDEAVQVRRELLPGGVRVPLPGGRSQLVDMEHYEIDAQPRVRVYTRIGPIASLGVVRMEVALRKNASLERGAFAIRDEQLVMTETFALDEMGGDEFEAAVRFLAETADGYEKAIYATDEN